MTVPPSYAGTEFDNVDVSQYDRTGFVFSNGYPMNESCYEPYKDIFAIDVRDPEAPKALRTLAHMVVAWDEDWSDLFLLHLASPDPVARHEAAMGLTIATMVTRDAGPAIALLEEAKRREKFPKLKDTLDEAIQVISGLTGGPVALKDPPPEPEAS